jgi:cobalt-zinc-cadmium efflux system outer membrane protein
LLLGHLILLGGCTWPVRKQTDQIVRELASHPYDLAPPEVSAKVAPKAKETDAPAQASDDEPKASLAAPTTDIQTTAYMQAARDPAKLPKYDLKIPSAIPGSEAPPIKITKDMTPEQRQQAIKHLYPELPPLPVVPTPQPGPNGRAYTLADLQQLAVENSPNLRQAAADLKAADGALAQAMTYANPMVGYSGQPTNNNSTTGAQGAFVQQHITMFGKRAMAVAAARKDYDNAALALRRARSDLATQVRNAYYGLLVAKETVRVNGALARFTDEIYRLYIGYLSGTIAAPYEPAAIRSQARSIRLAYQQAIYSYQFAWKQLVTALGLQQLPLTEVAGYVDRLIPYYDYDAVLAHIKERHTDVLTARNGVEKARYNLKLAQITPYPDFDVQAYVFKETTLAPFSIFYTVQVGFPLPIWDQNKGAITSAQAAMIRAVEEARRVELALTNNLETNYVNYQNNLKALEDYRRYILPDQVLAYRGVFERRRDDINASPGDLVAAQAALAANVTNYLGILGQLWTAVVSVADLMQIDDLFQMAERRPLPELPALENLPQWACPRDGAAMPSSPAVPGVEKALPTPRPLPVPRSPAGEQTPPATPMPVNRTEQLLEPPPAMPKAFGASATNGGGAAP